MINCKICRHPEVDVIHMMVRSGIEKAEIIAKFDDVKLRTLEKHIRQHMPEFHASKRVLGEIPVMQNDIQDSIADIDLCQAENSVDAEMIAIQKVFAVCGRLEEIARQTGSIKAEQALLTALDLAIKANSRLEFGSQD